MTSVKLGECGENNVRKVRCRVKSNAKSCRAVTRVLRHGEQPTGSVYVTTLDLDTPFLTDPLPRDSRFLTVDQPLCELRRRPDPRQPFLSRSRRSLGGTCTTPSCLQPGHHVRPPCLALGWPLVRGHACHAQRRQRRLSRVGAKRRDSARGGPLHLLHSCAGGHGQYGRCTLQLW